MREPVEVCAAPCGSYEYETVRAVLAEQFRLLRVEELVKPGCRVAVKPNLVTRSSPEEGAVTHPPPSSAPWFRFSKSWGPR